MAIHYLGDNGPDGTVLGTSASEKLGFYGLATAIVRPTVTPVSASSVTTTLNETRIKRLQTALAALGLISTTTS